MFSDVCSTEDRLHYAVVTFWRQTASGILTSQIIASGRKIHTRSVEDARILDLPSRGVLSFI